jgi:hypothetical protein
MLQAGLLKHSTICNTVWRLFCSMYFHREDGVFLDLYS